VVAMDAAGIAQWFGAFAGAELVADCGLVHDGAMGRFQYVQTQATWRRRGLCRALVHHVCRHAFHRLGLQRLVMCADPHDVAIGIYRSVGFVQVETHWCLQARPSRDAR
jgi:RimJ/RimL family protein N-acetyltransferase